MKPFPQSLARALAMIKRTLAICMTRNAAIALLLIASLLAPSFAEAAFSPAGIFAAGGGAGIGCAIGFILTIIVAGSGCIIGAAIGGGLGFVTGWFSGLADNTAQSIIQFAFWIIRFIGAFVVSLLLPYAAELLQAGIVLNIQSVTDFPPVQQAALLSSNLANLILVAVFIIIGLATILGMESYGMRKNLPLFILIVLVVNFSTVFVDLAANTGNVFMNFFWENSSLKNTPLSALILGNMKISSVVSGISAPVVEKMAANGALKGTEGTSSEAARAGLDLLIIVLGLFATYVMFRMGLVFLLRIGILWLLAIIAPLVFAASVLPPMRKHLQEWWKQLLNWAFIGPVTFFFFFFGLLLWVELNKSFIQGGLNSSQNASANAVAGLAPFYMFPLVMLFFMVAIKISKQMADAAANGIIDGALKIGKGVALGTLALGAGAALTGGGKVLGRVARSSWVKNAGDRMQRSRVAGIRGLGLGVTKLRDAEVKKEQERVQRGQAAYDDWVEEADMANIESQYKGARLNTGKKINILNAMIKHGKTLTPEMQKDAVRYGATRDPELRRMVRRLYPNQDESIYQGKDPSNPLDFEVLRRKFKAVGSSRHQVNLAGIGDPQDIADWKRSQAFYVLAGTQWNRNNWNALVEDPDHRKLADFRANLEQLRINIQIPAFMATLVNAGYNEDDVRKRVARLASESTNVVSQRSTTARGGEGTAPAP